MGRWVGRWLGGCVRGSRMHLGAAHVAFLTLASSVHRSAAQVLSMFCNNIAVPRPSRSMLEGVAHCSAIFSQRAAFESDDPELHSALFASALRQSQTNDNVRKLVKVRYFVVSVLAFFGGRPLRAPPGTKYLRQATVMKLGAYTLHCVPYFRVSAAIGVLQVGNWYQGNITRLFKCAPAHSHQGCPVSACAPTFCRSSTQAKAQEHPRQSGESTEAPRRKTGPRAPPRSG